MNLIIFTSPGCPACGALKKARTVDQFKALHGSKVNVIWHECAGDDPVADHYEVRHLPTLIFEDADGGELARLNHAPSFGMLTGAFTKTKNAEPDEVKIGAYPDVVKHFKK